MNMNINNYNNLLEEIDLIIDKIEIIGNSINKLSNELTNCYLIDDEIIDKNFIEDSKNNLSSINNTLENDIKEEIIEQISLLT